MRVHQPVPVTRAPVQPRMQRTWSRGARGAVRGLALGLAGCATTVDPAPPAPRAGQRTRRSGVAAPAAGSDSLPIVGPTAAPDTLQANGRGLRLRGRPAAPVVVIDLDDPSVRTDLWERVRAGFAMPDLDGDLVRKWEQWYASRPDYVQRMTERGGRYLFHIVEEVEKRGMPTELALLPFIESAFNPQAMSVARASGMWQFMPATGKHFDLTQNVFRDDRRDVLASTRAALDYLRCCTPVRRLAPGAGRLQLGRGQRAARASTAQQGRRRRPTTSACACPTRRATTCPSCRR